MGHQRHMDNTMPRGGASGVSGVSADTPSGKLDTPSGKSGIMLSGNLRENAWHNIAYFPDKISDSPTRSAISPTLQLDFNLLSIPI